MSLFSKDNMIMDLKVTTQKEVMQEFAELAQKNGHAKDADNLYKDLLAREEESTTGFGNGVAIPHTKSKEVLEASIFFARSSNLIEWQSLDDKPVNTWISLMIPVDQADVHLKLLAKLSRQLMHQDFIAILKNGSQEEVFEAIQNILIS
ncbi:PTS fructose transporter subunit IIA [Loigolactobacillus backii]|uniref:PTS fructose transporter subunit IIA n=1 Tax=Loigolactobacillus backii TaxID=375175 RepID=UPI000C1CBC16|nr:PTS fructose transporter subunit IIA [Loigolactobacillus backii]PIO82460.1 PTS fructose transporter subunit IIA [Loigolactobacillus backii]